MTQLMLIKQGSYGRDYLGAFVPDAQQDLGIGGPVFGGELPLKKGSLTPLESLCVDRLPSPA